MPPARITLREAAAAVSSIDPVMAKLAAEHGPPRLGEQAHGRHEVRAIGRGHLLSAARGEGSRGDLDPYPRHRRRTLHAGGRARGWLWRAPGRRFFGLQGGVDARLGEKVASGQVRLDRIGRLPDDEIVEELVQVKGIGPWTAEMFLIFTLRRLDVWPIGDYGVRVGYGRAYGLSDPPTAKDLLPLGDRFRPYRTIVAWYCWRVAGTKPPV